MDAQYKKKLLAKRWFFLTILQQQERIISPRRKWCFFFAPEIWSRLYYKKNTTRKNKISNDSASQWFLTWRTVTHGIFSEFICWHTHS